VLASGSAGCVFRTFHRTVGALVGAVMDGVTRRLRPSEINPVPAMKTLTTSIVLAVLMGLVSVAGVAARPAAKSSSTGPRFVLEAAVPLQFASWTQLPEQGAQVVNPQTKELLDKLYSQLLSRTYVNPQGYRIMLSLAYGDDQRGGLAAHKPEICYPAQGFTLQSLTETEVLTPFGSIAAKRLSTSMATSQGTRKEPVTYWFAVGDTAIKNKLQQRMVEMKLGLTGQIPDGLLFRVSSIDENPAQAYAMHDAFVKDLLGAVPVESRRRLSGLGAQPDGS
jgi:EpsI family protein